ncbi:MAG: GAF domain-containing protein [Bacillota bacterium]
MFIPVEKSEDKLENYKRLIDTLPYYLNDTDPWYTTLSNAASILNYFLDDVNWVGFYLNESDALYLGPFQGLAACTKIMMGNGVCGTAAKNEETLVVEDVNQFEGHITCDSNSQSEIVVPFKKEGLLFGVLDIDSPKKMRFDEADKENLEKVMDIVVDKL